MDVTLLWLKTLYDKLASRAGSSEDELWAMDEIVEFWLDRIMFPDRYRFLIDYDFWKIDDENTSESIADEDVHDALWHGHDFKGRMLWRRMAVQRYSKTEEVI